MRRCVLVSGGEIRDYGRIRSLLREDDFFLYCDSGLLHEQGLGRKPDLTVGDFDSHPRPDSGEVLVLPREKDDTDTFFGAKEALRRGFGEFLMVGALGGRTDHSLGNLSVLLMLHEKGKKAVLADDYSLMEIVGAEPAEIPDTCPWFSVLCIGGPASGVTIRNAKYPLENGEITCSWQYGISNEVLPGKTASVRAQRGKLLLIRVDRDSHGEKPDKMC